METGTFAPLSWLSCTNTELSIFWANAGLGAASVPNFWKVFHAGDCTVHRTEIESLTNDNTVTLRNCTQFQTDFIILCTGFDKSYQPFSDELQQICGLASDPLDGEKWAKLEANAEETVCELLPALKHSPLPVPECANHEQTAGAQKMSHGPSRHYRRLIVPALAAQGDRSIYFPGFIHSIYTPLVSEVQALWGVAFLLGLHDLPTQGEMEKEVAEWNVWSRKRYITQGKKHAYAIFDFLSVSTYTMYLYQPTLPVTACNLAAAVRFARKLTHTSILTHWSTILESRRRARAICSRNFSYQLPLETTGA
jgi:dimethylaniline monooxygenase (N-oxide forming)